MPSFLCLFSRQLSRRWVADLASYITAMTVWMTVQLTVMEAAFNELNMHERVCVGGWVCACACMHAKALDCETSL